MRCCFFAHSIARLVGRLGLMLSAISSIALLLPMASAQPEPEPTTHCSESSEPLTGFPLSYGGHTSGCTINPAIDFDTFRFVCETGDNFVVSMLGTTNFFAPCFAVFNPSGVLMHTECCNGPCSVAETLVCTEPGRHTILASDNGNNNTGNYVLSLHRRPPPYCVPDLPYGATISDMIGHGTDRDYLRFDGNAGTNVRITLQGTTNFFSPFIVIFDPLGNELHSQSCNGPCSFIVDAPINPLPETGTYTVEIGDLGLNNTGQFNVGIECLPPFGCPINIYVQNLVFSDKETLEWDLLAGNYDVIKGDLSTLREADGDYSTAVARCLVENGGDTTALDDFLPCRFDGDPVEPIPDKACFYLSRRNNRSYDNSWGPRQLCGRNASLSQSPDACF